MSKKKKREQREICMAFPLPIHTMEGKVENQIFPKKKNKEGRKQLSLSHTIIPQDSNVGKLIPDSTPNPVTVLSTRIGVARPFSLA
jgi:hypothetical protein